MTSYSLAASCQKKTSTQKDKKEGLRESVSEKWQLGKLKEGILCHLAVLRTGDWIREYLHLPLLNRSRGCSLPYLACCRIWPSLSIVQNSGYIPSTKAGSKYPLQPRPAKTWYTKNSNIGIPADSDVIPVYRKSNLNSTPFSTSVLRALRHLSVFFSNSAEYNPKTT